MADEEIVVLDGLNLTVAPFEIEDWVPGVAKPRPAWQTGPDTDGAVLDEEPRYDLVESLLRVRIWQDDPSAMAAALAALGQLVEMVADCARRPDGLPVTWTPAGRTISYTMYALLGEIEDLPIHRDGDLAGWLSARPVVVVKLTRRPFLYRPEALAAQVASQTGPLVVISDATTVGDVAAEGRLVVVDAAGKARRYVEWGLEQRHSSSHPLLLDSTALLTAGYSGVTSTLSDAHGGSAISATIAAPPTGLCGIPAQPHVGTFRVRARAFAGSTAVQFRLLWRVGDGPLRPNPVARPAATPWTDLDLGLITVPVIRNGIQAWSGYLEVSFPGGPAGEAVFVALDLLRLFPAEQGYGVARAPYTHRPGVLEAHDSFTGATAGLVLHGRVAAVGGYWVTGTFYDDTATEDWKLYFGTLAQRAGAGSRIALLGADRGGPQEVGARFAFSHPVTHNAWMGVKARYPGTGGGAGAMAGGAIAVVQTGRADYHGQPAPPMFSLLRPSGGGSYETLAEGKTVPQIVQSGWFQIRLICYAPGHLIAQLLTDEGGLLCQLETQDARYATGGTDATGRCGLHDFQASPAVGTHYVDDFYIAEPSAEPLVIHPNRKLEITHQDALREGPDGASWGAPPAYRGSRLFVPCDGPDNLGTRIAVRAAQNDLRTGPDSPVADTTSVSLYTRPRYLTPR
jgi:hypothetical protein